MLALVGRRVVLGGVEGVACGRLLHVPHIVLVVIGLVHVVLVEFGVAVRVYVALVPFELPPLCSQQRPPVGGSGFVLVLVFVVGEQVFLHVDPEEVDSQGSQKGGKIQQNSDDG